MFELEWEFEDFEWDEKSCVQLQNQIYSRNFGNTRLIKSVVNR